MKGIHLNLSLISLQVYRSYYPIPRSSESSLGERQKTETFKLSLFRRIEANLKKLSVCPVLRENKKDNF